MRENTITTGVRVNSASYIDRFRNFLLLTGNTNTLQLDRGENRLELQPNGSGLWLNIYYSVQFLFN